MRRSAKQNEERDSQKAPFDLGTYPMFFMAHILHEHAEGMAVALREHDLNNSAWRVLASLQYRDGQTIKDLAFFTTLERSFVSRILVQLEERGLIRREIPPDDRRISRAFLTDAGMHVFCDLLLPVVQDQMSHAFAGMKKDEVTELLRMLTRVMENLYRAGRSRPPFLTVSD